MRPLLIHRYPQRRDQLAQRQPLPTKLHQDRVRLAVESHRDRLER